MHGRRLARAHYRDGRGREIVVDRADRAAEQRVDQGALALLELADDADDGLRARRAAPDRVESLAEVVAVEPGCASARTSLTTAIDLPCPGRDHGPAGIDVGSSSSGPRV